jgi:hypothetical protein
LYALGWAPVKAMYRSTLAAMAFLMSLTFVGTPPAAAGSTVAAASRCNSRMIGDYAGEVRDYDAHPSAVDLASLQKRFNDINEVLKALGQERSVLDSVCTSDADKAPLFAYAGATASYALALQSDVAVRINQPCPDAARAVAKALLAPGWLNLAQVVNDAGGTPPKDVTEAAPRIQKRAAVLGLTLPVWADTSAYWRDQVANQAKAAIQACSSPAPSTTATP